MPSPPIPARIRDTSANTTMSDRFNRPDRFDPRIQPTSAAAAVQRCEGLGKYCESRSVFTDSPGLSSRGALRCNRPLRHLALLSRSLPTATARGLFGVASAGSRSALQALELPRREATIVQTVAPDLRSRAQSPQHTPQRPSLGRRGSSKFKLGLYLAESDPTPADRTALASAAAAYHAMRFGRRQSAALYRCSSFVSEARLVERGSEPRG